MHALHVINNSVAEYYYHLLNINDELKDIESSMFKKNEALTCEDAKRLRKAIQDIIKNSMHLYDEVNEKEEVGKRIEEQQLLLNDAGRTEVLQGVGVERV